MLNTVQKMTVRDILATVWYVTVALLVAKIGSEALGEAYETNP
jgi:hypothetical protein